jgi:hypothetical protein
MRPSVVAQFSASVRFKPINTFNMRCFEEYLLPNEVDGENPMVRKKCPCLVHCHVKHLQRRNICPIVVSTPCGDSTCGWGRFAKTKISKYVWTPPKNYFDKTVFLITTWDSRQNEMRFPVEVFSMNSKQTCSTPKNSTL